jgi:hypothetical protein
VARPPQPLTGQARGVKTEVGTLNRRNRTVIFRVTEQEYNCLKSACAAAGGRSLSDYTRSELLCRPRDDSSDSLIRQRFLEMDQKLTEIQALAQQMFDALGAGMALGGNPRFFRQS